MKITLLTPTGDRPEAFALCERWMARQTIAWDQWIVVDDGVSPTATTLNQQVIRKPPMDGHSLCRNLEAGLTHATGDLLVFVEDDDWYGPTHLQVCRDHAESGGLIVGQSVSVYHHTRLGQTRKMSHLGRASLCSTAVRQEAWTDVRDCLKGNASVDMRLWHRVKPAVSWDAPLTVIGIKGGPGRSGIGRGHTVDFYSKAPKVPLSSYVGETDASVIAKGCGRG